MSQQKTELLSNLLRDMEAEIGTNATATTSLYSLTDAIDCFKADSYEEFLAQFKDLYNIISHTKPRFGILNYRFALMLCDLEEAARQKDFDSGKWRKFLKDEVSKILKVEKEHEKAILKHAESINVEGKTILIHDHSHTVHRVLKHFKRLGRNFRVIIAEQDYDKTHDNIEEIHGAKIPFQVVPSYMLSQVDHEIDMAFFGALTLKSTMDFVMDPGTHGIITEFHVARIPVYMFIDTAKFSLWKAAKKEETFVHHHTRSHHSKPIDYERIKYSHDRVPATLFNKIITNKGHHSPLALEKLFREKMDQCELFSTLSD